MRGGRPVVHTFRMDAESSGVDSYGILHGVERGQRGSRHPQGAARQIATKGYQGLMDDGVAHPGVAPGRATKKELVSSAI